MFIFDQIRQSLQMTGQGVARFNLAEVEFHKRAGYAAEKNIPLFLNFLAQSGIIDAQVARQIVMIGGRYQALQFIGQGGMGGIILAQDMSKLKRRVAIKYVLGSIDPQDKARFDREAELGGRMNHQGICRFLDIVETRAMTFIVMEIIDGTTLDNYIQEKKLALNLEKALDVFESICQAVEYMHKLRIIHRDLKPGNIMINDKGIKLIDLGLAKEIDSEDLPLSKQQQSQIISSLSMLNQQQGETALTEAGAFMGTPGYMAPEQAGDDKVGIQADIYALGTILYQLLSGEKAFPDKVIVKVLNNQYEENFLPARNHNPQIREDMEAIIAKCLARSRSKRYRSVSQLLLDIHNYRKQKPVIARNYTLKEKGKLFVSRNKKTITLTTFVTLIFTLLVAFYQTNAANLQSEIAKKQKASASKERKLRKVSDELRAKQEKDIKIFQTYKKARPYLEQADEMYARYREPKRCLELYKKVFKIYADADLWMQQPYIARFNAGFLNNILGKPNECIENYKISNQLFKAQYGRPYIKALLYTALQKQALETAYGQKGKLKEARKDFEVIQKMKGLSEQDAVQIGLAKAYDLWIQHSWKHSPSKRLELLKAALGELGKLKKNTQLDVFFEYFKLRGRIQSEIYRMKFYLGEKPDSQLLQKARSDFFLAWRYSTNNVSVVIGLAQTCERLGFHYYGKQAILAIQYYDEAAHFYNLCHEMEPKYEYQVRRLYAKARWARLLYSAPLMEYYIKKSAEIYKKIPSTDTRMRKLLVQDTAIWLIKDLKRGETKNKYLAIWQGK